MAGPMTGPLSDEAKLSICIGQLVAARKLIQRLKVDDTELAAADEVLATGINMMAMVRDRWSNE